MLRYIGDLLSGELEFIDFIIYFGSVCFVVFCATPLHEYAHALIAVKLGDDTPRLRGRLTINPMAHIHPIGALLILLCGFGYAKPVEVRMRNFKKPKRDMALVALAGPVCNLLQAFIYVIIYAVLNYSAYNSGSETLFYVSAFFFYAGYININLAVFNLLPVPPLDGSRLVTALLPAKYYYGLMKYERYIMIGLMVLLFTGILTTPLSWLSEMIFSLFESVAYIPLKLLG